MAKFKIEVELDWLNDEEYTIDDEIREQVIKGVKNELLKKASEAVAAKLDSAIAEKLKEATKVIEQRVEDFIAVVTESQIEKIRIPKKVSTDYPPGEMRLSLFQSASLLENSMRHI